MDSAQGNDFSKLKLQIDQAGLPSDLATKLNEHLARLEKAMAISGYRLEFEREINYIKFVSSLPFHKSSEDILDLRRAAEILDRNHYGLRSVKDRILEYLSVLILNKQGGHQGKTPVLSFIGLVGSGKTSLAYSIAESLGRKVVRIPFGGLGSVGELRGQSRVKPEAEAGRIMEIIHDSGVNNPVILLDEIDRVAAEARADVMGVLVELLDPEQNFSFHDFFVDYPFDLSKVLFIATANNTSNIATAVLDRLEIVEMPSYSDTEKVAIGKDFILPRVLKDAGVNQASIIIDEGLWPQIVRPLGFDAGVRSLQRSVEKMVRKIARSIVEGNPGPYRITAENMAQYLG